MVSRSHGTVPILAESGAGDLSGDPLDARRDAPEGHREVGCQPVSWAAAVIGWAAGAVAGAGTVVVVVEVGATQVSRSHQ